MGRHQYSKMIKHENNRSRLAALRVLGFDRSRSILTSGGVHVGCSQCEALVVNNVPTHETGCSNQNYECRGCNTRVKRRGTYCEDCR